MRTRHRQQGWAGIVVLLIVLLAIAVLSRTMLRQYGLLPDSQAPKTVASPRSPGDAAAGPVDPTTTPMPASAIERARGVEATVQKQADDAAKRIDEQSK